MSGNLLTWTDNSSDETAFVIERKAEGCLSAALSFVELTTTAANETSYFDDAVEEGVTYCYRIRARNADGDSAPSPSMERRVPRLLFT